MAMKNRSICEIAFNEMSIPIYTLEQGKRALDGIFMIGETIKVERPVKSRMARKRIIKRGVDTRGKGAQAEKTKARRKLVAKLFSKGLNKSQIMKETGASFITVTKDLEALGKGRKIRAKGGGRVKKEIKGKGMRRATRGSRENKPKPIETQEKGQKKEGGVRSGTLK